MTVSAYLPRNKEEQGGAAIHDQAQNGNRPPPPTAAAAAAAAGPTTGVAAGGAASATEDPSFGAVDTVWQTGKEGRPTAARTVPGTLEHPAGTPAQGGSAGCPPAAAAGPRAPPRSRWAARSGACKGMQSSEGRDCSARCSSHADKVVQWSTGGGRTNTNGACQPAGPRRPAMRCPGRAPPLCSHPAPAPQLACRRMSNARRASGAPHRLCCDAHCSSAAGATRSSPFAASL